MGANIKKSMSHSIASIIGNTKHGYHAEVWSALGTCVSESDHGSAQDAHEWVESIAPGVETRFLIAMSEDAWIEKIEAPLLLMNFRELEGFPL